MFYNQNGEIVSAVRLEVNNRSFLYGDGLFERLRLFNGQVFNRKNHYNRLSFSLKELQLNISVSIDELFEQVEYLAHQNGLTSCSARISIYRNSGGLYTPETLHASYVIETIREASNYFSLGYGLLINDLLRALTLIYLFLKRVRFLHHLFLKVLCWVVCVHWCKTISQLRR